MGKMQKDHTSLSCFKCHTKNAFARCSIGYTGVIFCNTCNFIVSQFRGLDENYEANYEKVCSQLLRDTAGSIIRRARKKASIQMPTISKASAAVLGIGAVGAAAYLIQQPQSPQLTAMLRKKKLERKKCGKGRRTQAKAKVSVRTSGKRNTNTR